MKPASSKEIKDELNHLSKSELSALCLRLLRFKKENKELVSYLLFESQNEEAYLLKVKGLMDEEFTSFFFK